MGKGDSIEAITSVPCFELWILLHFGYTTMAFGSSGSFGSVCASVIKALKKHIPVYTKGTSGHFSALKERLPAAMVHASRLEKYTEASGSDNPSTQMHKLIEYLREVKRTA